MYTNGRGPRNGHRGFDGRGFNFNFGFRPARMRRRSMGLFPFAALFAVCGPFLLSLVALALVLGVWLARLSRPAVPLLLSALGFTLLLPDPAFFALGLVPVALHVRHVA